MLFEVKKNLQMLDAVLSLPKEEIPPKPKHKRNGSSTEDPAAAELERRHAAYARTSRAISDLHDWFEKLCADSGFRGANHALGASTASLPTVRSVCSTLLTIR